jgi:subtilase family serine protease
MEFLAFSGYRLRSKLFPERASGSLPGLDALLATMAMRLPRWIAGALTMAIALAAAILVPGIAAATGSVRIVGNHPAEAADIAAGARVAPERVLRMRVTLKLRDRAGLDSLLAAQQDPSSPQYHRWLTPDEFNARFGPTDADAQKVARWLTASGFTVDAIGAGDRYIEFHSSAANAERGFAVHIGASADGRYFANREDPALPADIAPLVGAIEGLANTGRAMPMVQSELAAGDSLTAVAPDVRIDRIKHRFGPNDLYTFYDYTPLQNAGVDGSGTDCIALIEDSQFPPESVDTFDSEFGLPVADVSIVEADPLGGPPGPDAIEAQLDVEYAHAAAPGAGIVAYIGNPSDNSLGNEDGWMFDALSRVVSDDICGAISISFGTCGEVDVLFTSTLDGLFAQAASQGQAVFVSSGDSGAAGLNDECAVVRERAVNELAANPNVTAVGGTQFRPKYSKAGDDIGSRRERVWHDRTGASGGGESALFAKPSFQSGVFPQDPNRDIPDVSFAASNKHPGFFMALGGEIVCCTGGTSLGAPYWAGIDALVAQQAGETRTGNLNARLYALGAQNDPATSGLRDVRRGNNNFHHVKGFRARKGYDKATGWGTPDIAILVPALAAGP